MSDLRLLSCRGGEFIARKIAQRLDVELTPVEILDFSNENIFVKILASVREADCFVVQGAAPPLNHGIMELLIMLDALKLASAKRLTAVLPYFPYSRSDKKDQPRISVTARLVADLLEAAGCSRVITMNLHSPQVQGFFRYPTDLLYATAVILDYYRGMDLSNAVAVSPDAGSAKLVEKYARGLDIPMAILDKRRYSNREEAEILRIVGDVEGKDAIVFDDEVATGGSLIETTKALISHGAVSVRACCVHGVLAGQARSLIEQSPLKELVVTDTFPVQEGGKVKVLSVAHLIAEAIRAEHAGTSVTSLSPM